MDKPKRIENVQTVQQTVQQMQQNALEKEGGFQLFCKWRKPYLQEKNMDDKHSIIQELQNLWEHEQTPKQRMYWGFMAQGKAAFPKRLNAYMLFCNIIRDDIQFFERERTGHCLSISEIGTQLGEMWRTLSDRELTFWKDMERWCNNTN